MRHGNSQVDMPHPLATDNGSRDFHAAFLADHAVVADPFVLAAEALEVLGGTEDALAEESIRLRTLCAVVDGLRLGHLAAGPAKDVLGAGDGQGDCVEGIGCAGDESHTRRGEELEDERKERRRRT